MGNNKLKDNALKKVRVCMTIDPELHARILKLDAENLSGFSFHVGKALTAYLETKETGE
jgi:hypothetical protein